MWYKTHLHDPVSKLKMTSNNNMETSGEGQSSRDYTESPSLQDPTDQSGSGNNASPKSYAKSYSRVSKDNLYMIIALWMEDFPEDVVDDDPVHYRNVGAVLVLPNDVIFAADCSRDGVHAVARLLMKHGDKAQGCKMFMSRKPCPFCAKLLVQSKVERVSFLPREPEYYLDDDVENKRCMQQVDNMFTASPIAQTRFVLQVEEHVLVASTATRKSGKKEEEIKRLIRDCEDELRKQYDFSPEWIGSNAQSDSSDQSEQIGSIEIKGEVMKYFHYAMNWMARAIALPERELKFETVIKKTETTFDPVNIHEKQARHFMTIARFLAERTDDPKTGVGAVIVSPEMEILAFGWNGFPFKALYGEFARASKTDDSESDESVSKDPRASTSDESENSKNNDTDKPAPDAKKKVLEKKTPYVIHAEQNALLMRNEKNIKGAILFVTRSPCNECAPLIAMQGIKTVVVDGDVLAEGRKVGYGRFLSMVRKGRFVCFQTRKRQSNLDRGKGSKKRLSL